MSKVKVWTRLLSTSATHLDISAFLWVTLLLVLRSFPGIVVPYVARCGMSMGGGELRISYNTILNCFQNFSSWTLILT